ncbi:MAG: peptidase [Ignavibacteria bacterium]|nr:peptidase [Ignavibacteria bacterium]
MKKYFIFCLIIFLNKPLFSQENIYVKDFIYFWETFRDNYGYFDNRQTDWNKVKEIYLPEAQKIDNRTEFISMLERVIAELYDNHTHLLTNLSSSYRLTPSGLDIWPELENNKYIIKEVRAGSGADFCGIKPGMEIIQINNLEIGEAIMQITGKAINNPGKEVKEWAIRTLLAGNYETKRVLKLSYNGEEFIREPDKDKDTYSYFKYDTNIKSKILENNIGYIIINNSLGDETTVQMFDSVLNSIWNTRALIIDLRETPGGGSSIVARGIMSRFINEPMPYQVHLLPAEEKLTGVKRGWVEYVYPRGIMYDKPLIILVNHWTGSMGEGIAIGFDALNRAEIIGTRMAGLVGAKYDFKLPETGIGVSYSAEKLFHVNGTPRENYVPDILVEPDDKPGDLILETAIKFLNEKIK